MKTGRTGIMNDRKTTTVTILQQDFTLQCPAEEVALLKQAADYLDEKLAMSKDKYANQSIDRILILTALSLCQELFLLQQEKSTLRSMPKERVRALTNKISDALALVKTN